MSDSEINLDTSRHLEELKQLKEVDYEFYKYLEEHGQDLLNPVGFSEEPEEDEIKIDREELLGTDFGLPRLDKGRFYEIRESLESTKSLKGLGMLLSCFRSVANINTILNEDVPTKSNIEKSKKKVSKNASSEAKTHQKERNATFQIDDPDLMLEITIYVLEKVPELFWLHSSGGRGMEEFTSDIIPESLPKWFKVERHCKAFWQDLSSLILNNCLSLQPNLEFIKDVFSKVSNPLLILWLFPNRLLTNRFTTLLSRVWTMNRYIVLKQGAFGVLRSMNSRFEKISQRFTEGKEPRYEFFDKEDILNNPVKRHEEFLLILHRTIGISAMRGVSWKNYFSSTQVINDYLLLLQESQHEMVYRIAYNIIRKLGSMLRILYLRISRASNAKSSQNKPNSSAKQKKLFEEVIANLFSWKFLTFIRIWSLAISSISELYPLQYPLVTIVSSIAKLKLSSVAFLPYTLQTLAILTEVALSNRVLIPISDMLIDIHSTIERGFKLTFSKSSQGSLKSTSMITAASKPFIPELEIKIGNSISKSYQVYDSLLEFWAYIVTMYISSLYKHPSFPEFVLGITPNLKKLQKHSSRYWNDHVNRQIKDIIKKTEIHSEAIKDLRSSVSTNEEFLELLNNTDSGKKSLPAYSDKVYNDLVYSSAKSDACSGKFAELENYISDVKSRRAELVKGKIRLSSMKAMDQNEGEGPSHQYSTVEDDQQDIEFKILIQQLQKAGKSINDIRNLGPRQLKKLKKSIKAQIADYKESAPHNQPNKPGKRSHVTAEIQERNRNKRNKTHKLESEGPNELSTTPNINEVSSSITQHDTIEDWDINSEDCDNS
ncbi:hypothetical protein OJ252_2692 [Cryptosporidium canis]|uniref:Noc2p family protein n=1 Tax=Cryptosporidium canis TaxID=195482 RepID=A0ABQ8P5D5_9CRYT|nr:hypothetical protein OJ252_2692 [Cryptosporidium canis]